MTAWRVVALSAGVWLVIMLVAVVGEAVTR
jgi:hypothetical protein